MQYIRDSKPAVKRFYAKRQTVQHSSRNGRSTLGHHRDGSNNSMMNQDLVDMRAHTALCPNIPSQKPREIAMPNLLDPDLVFASKDSKVIINKIRENLKTLC